ncbi:dihydrofolate reductase [Apibacter adventoris]|uniref:dihydrofolate reductase n=1 Tax=Apibacter adventoris TaxID=1679466 RepID=UPI000CF70182|nr:dihydrofolate reductase [Apibacter adventoris]PQL96082.1 diacylglycerol kinase [Apibacter adventoris]
MRIIVAMDENNAIGKDNQLLWNLPDDLKRFKKLTLNHPVIMGRNTFESITKPLPNRLNIIISNNLNYIVPEGAILTHSLQEAIEIAKKVDADPFVIGGSTIYKQALDFIDAIEVTRVHTKVNEADTFFPNLNLSKWNKTYEEFHPKDEKHIYDFTFLTFQKYK